MTSKQNTGSSLLKLPGELRNRIYEFALEDPSSRIQLRHKVRSPRSRCASCVTSRAKVSKRTLYNLTQVCRAIRQEYLPVHRAQTRIYINWMELPWYLATFSPDDIASGSAASNIVAIFSNCRNHESEQRTHQVDFLPLIKYNRASPGVTVAHEHIRCKAYPLQPVPGPTPASNRPILGQQLFNLLLDPIKYPKFHDFIENDVTHVTYHFKPYSGPTLMLGLKDGHAHPWMLMITSAYPNTFIFHAYQHWRNKLGLDLAPDVGLIRFQIDIKGAQQKRLRQQLRYLTGSATWGPNGESDSEGDDNGDASFLPRSGIGQDNHIRQLRDSIDMVLAESRDQRARPAKPAPSPGHKRRAKSMGDLA